MFWEFLILVILALFLLYRWATLHNDFFKERGIPYHKPYPLIGSMYKMVLRKMSMFDLVVELYNVHNGKIFGVFDQRKPVLMIRDPELIKQITIKDFAHFVNHRSIFNSSEDNGSRSANLFGNSLFSMRDAKWKDMRNTLTPVFTGSKMRQMFQLMNKVAQETVECVRREHADSDDGLELDVKDYCTRFTNDIIASTAFGLQVNSLEQRDNEFYKMGKKLTTFTIAQNLKFLAYANFKYLMKFFAIEIFDKDATKYFMRLVLDAMKYRQEHNIIRPDMINMLMEARDTVKSDNMKTHNREWTDIDIVAQCFIFFFAGFETSAVLMCFTAHELMENPDIQEKLFTEIEGVSGRLNGRELTYEELNGMKYMDQVVSEVLRKWPAAIAIDRECNKDITYEVDGKRIEIKAGDLVWLPLCGIHRDPKYFENPLKFDPERFNEVNKNKINQFTYFPFGVGPRNCIGSRFALLEAKALLFYLLRDFRIAASKKSTVPLKLSAAGFQLKPKNGFWLKFIKRN